MYQLQEVSTQTPSYQMKHFLQFYKLLISHYSCRISEDLVCSSHCLPSQWDHNESPCCLAFCYGLLKMLLRSKPIGSLMSEIQYLLYLFIYFLSSVLSLPFCCFITKFQSDSQLLLSFPLNLVLLDHFL